MKHKLLIETVVCALVVSLMPNGISSAETGTSSIEQKRQEIKERDKKNHQLEKKKALAEQDQKDVLAHIQETKEKQSELSGGKVSIYSGEKFYWPVDGAPLTSSFGMRYHPIKKTYRMHEGIDIGGGKGAAIKAAAPGEVIEACPSNGYGYIIVIYHGDGLSTLYAHMYARTVKVAKGQMVDRGQVIADVGSNGWATGPHLHFEVHKNGTALDPLSFF